MQVIVGRAFNRRIGILANVQPQYTLLFLIKTRGFDIGHEGIDAAVIEAHAIDDGVCLRQAEHARLWIAGLRARRDRADFKRAKAECSQAIDICAILVEAGSKADRVRKTDAHDGTCIGRRARQDFRQAELCGFLQCWQCEVMRFFRIHRKQHGAGERVQEFFNHGDASQGHEGRSIKWLLQKPLQKVLQKANAFALRTQAAYASSSAA